MASHRSCGASLSLFPDRSKQKGVTGSITRKLYFNHNMSMLSMLNAWKTMELAVLVVSKSVSLTGEEETMEGRA